jgi:hypothetical protein
MRRSYTLYICPRCGEHYIFAGACDDDGAKLIARRVVPVTVIEEFRDISAENSSPVPRWFVENFVQRLLEYVGVKQKDLDELRSDP